MAFLKYRGSTTAPGTWTSSAAANAPLTNLDIDKNFASLDSQKLNLTGGTITGALAIGQNLTAEFKDDQVGFVDGTDTSKKLALQLSGITASTTRTLTVPNQNGTIALTSDIVDTLATVTGRGASTATAISITNNTASTSTSTGALIVTGGVGIGGALVVGGNLTVNGTTTTINATTVSVDDKNIELGSVASPTNITADGGGITLKGTTDKTFNWVNSTSAWTSSEDLNLLTGKQYEINGTPVLNSTTLGSGVTGSSLTSLATITTGVWQGTSISTAYTDAKITSITAGNSITVSGTGNITINHADTSTAANLTASSRTYVTGLTFDTFGHVTAYATGTETVVDTTYSQAAVTTTGGALLRLAGSNSVNDDVKFASGTNTTVAYTDANTITISSINTTYSAGTATNLGLIKLEDDTVQTVAANIVTTAASRTYGIQVNAAGQAVVNVPWGDTTYNIATSTVAGLVELASDTVQTVAANAVSATASRTYGIQVNAAGQAVVNVPWVDTDTNTDTLQTIADDTTTNATYYPSFVTATTGAQTAKVSSTKLTFNPSTGTLSSTNFDSLSDARYKKDFQVITSAISKVTQLTGYTYTLIESDKRSTGLTAQEVEQVLPEAVTDGDRKTLNYGAMMGLIVEALKEINAKVDKLQNQIENK